jgi:hypothetical protein
MIIDLRNDPTPAELKARVRDAAGREIPCLYADDEAGVCIAYETVPGDPHLLLVDALGRPIPRTIVGPIRIELGDTLRTPPMLGDDADTDAANRGRRIDDDDDSGDVPAFLTRGIEAHPALIVAILALAIALLVGLFALADRSNQPTVAPAAAVRPAQHHD